MAWITLTDVHVSGIDPLTKTRRERKFTFKLPKGSAIANAKLALKRDNWTKIKVHEAKEYKKWVND